jgi:hypothetical protein
MNYPIKKGARGADVETIQLALGIPPETKGFGYFGNMTESKLMAKIGKKSIDNEADFNALVPPLRGNVKEIFNKLKRGEKLSQAERDQINKGIGKLQGVFQTVKSIFGKKDPVLDSASGGSGSVGDVASGADSGAGSGAKTTSEGLSMTAKIGIGVGVLAVLTTVIILATRKGK